MLYADNPDSGAGSVSAWNRLIRLCFGCWWVSSGVRWCSSSKWRRRLLCSRWWRRASRNGRLPWKNLRILLYLYPQMAGRPRTPHFEHHPYWWTLPMNSPFAGSWKLTLAVRHSSPLPFCHVHPRTRHRWKVPHNRVRQNSLLYIGRRSNLLPNCRRPLWFQRLHRTGVPFFPCRWRSAHHDRAAWRLPERDRHHPVLTGRQEYDTTPIR